MIHETIKMNTSNVVRCLLLFTSVYMLHATTLASSTHMATFATPSFVLVGQRSYMHVANQFQYLNSNLQSSLQEPYVTVNDVNKSTKSTSKSSILSTYMPMDLLPPKENWEANSTHRLSRIELQKAMTKLKRFVESRLESDLNVFEVRCLICVCICTWYSIYNTRVFCFTLCVTYDTLCILYTYKRHTTNL